MYIRKVYLIHHNYRDKTHMFKKFASGKINGTKRHFFLWRAPAHHSFTFNL